MKKVKITFEVENCAKCPFHERHSIVTADSFEHESGIYCSLVEDQGDSWWHYTYDGKIAKRLVVADDWHPERYANVPGWCPFLIKHYVALITDICDSASWREYTEPKINHIRNSALYVINFLSELAEASSETFVYNNLFNCTEQDIYLSVISISLYYAEENARNEFLNNSDIPEDDKKIITDVVSCWSNKSTLLKDFKKIRNKTQKGLKPILNTSIVIKIAMFLADKYADTDDTDYTKHMKDFLKPKKKLLTPTP